MIDEIQVEDIALIRKASFAPACGLTVLTGETGAGKTALLTACKLLMGARADKTMVREGAQGAQVSGRFFENAASGSEAGEDDGELVVTRKLTSDGRSRVSINGQMASVSELSSRIAPHIDLCSQHEHQALMKPSSHVRLLDAWAAGEVCDLLASYQHAFAAAQEASAEREHIRSGRATSAAQLDEARFTLRQIDAVDPREGEYEELLAYLSKAEHAEALARAADGAHVSVWARLFPPLMKALVSTMSWRPGRNRFARWATCSKMCLATC